MTSIDPVDLTAKKLVRCPSVTPARWGGDNRCVRSLTDAVDCVADRGGIKNLFFARWASMGNTRSFCL